MVNALVPASKRIFPAHAIYFTFFHDGSCRTAKISPLANVVGSDRPFFLVSQSATSSAS
jgi:hypothetical protein